MESVVRHIWTRHKGLFGPVPVTPVVQLHRHKKDAVVPLAPLADFFDVAAGGSRTPEEVLAPSESRVESFDSSVEEQVYARLQGRGDLRCKVCRDAEILLAPEVATGRCHVFIPDFQLKYHGESLFVEVVGYWTQQYKDRKIARLNALPHQWHQKLILLVDKTIGFPRTPFPTYEYEGKEFPIGNLVTFIQAWEDGIYARHKKKCLQALLSRLMQLTAESGGCLPEQVKDAGAFETIAEARHFLREVISDTQVGATYVLLLGDVLAVKKRVLSWLASIERVFAEAQVECINKTDLAKQLPPEFPRQWLDNILHYGSYTLKFRNLLEVSVHRASVA